MIFHYSTLHYRLFLKNNLSINLYFLLIFFSVENVYISDKSPLNHSISSCKAIYKLLTLLHMSLDTTMSDYSG